MIKPLTDKQKERLKILEPKLDAAIQKRDYETAKSLVIDIQNILRPTLHYVRLCHSKNKLYELAIEIGEFEFAISGLKSNLQTLNQRTRTYLETTSLLAICYGRVFPMVSANVLALGAVADFGAQNCQYTTKVDARQNVQLTTSPAIEPNACYQ